MPKIVCPFCDEVVCVRREDDFHSVNEVVRCRNCGEAFDCDQEDCLDSY